MNSTVPVSIVNFLFAQGKTVDVCDSTVENVVIMFDVCIARVIKRTTWMLCTHCGAI